MVDCVEDIKMFLPPPKQNDLKLQVNSRYLLLQRLVRPSLTISKIRPESINEAKVTIGLNISYTTECMRTGDTCEDDLILQHLEHQVNFRCLEKRIFRD